MATLSFKFTVQFVIIIINDFISNSRQLLYCEDGTIISNKSNRCQYLFAKTGGLV